MQPQMQAVVHMDKKDMLVCACGGVGLIFQAAFLPKHSMVVGAKPEIVPVVIILCSMCGRPLEPPFTRAGDIKEAS